MNWIFTIALIIIAFFGVLAIATHTGAVAVTDVGCPVHP